MWLLCLGCGPVEQVLEWPHRPKAKQQIEFVKDPGNIDEMLDDVVKYREIH